MRRIIIFLCFCHFVQSLYSLELKTDFQESPPKYFVENDTIKGLCVEIIDSLNMQLESEDIYIVAVDPGSPFVPFSRIQARLREEETDIFVGMARSSGREVHYQFLDTPCYEVCSIFAKKASSSFEFNSPSDLIGQTVGVVAGSKTGKQLESLEGIEIFGVQNLEQGIKMLDADRLDLFFYHSLGLGFSIKKLGLSDELILTKNSYENYAHYIAFNKSISPAVMEKVEEALKTLHAEDMIITIMESYHSP